MVPYDAFTGEFRLIMLDFDPGFGHETGKAGGNRAVLEVRSYGVPFMISHGQLVGDPNTSAFLDAGFALWRSSRVIYQKQGLKLSKHFKPWKHDPV